MLRFLYLSQRLIEGAHHVWIDDILPTVHPQTEQVVGVSQRHAVDGEEGPHERRTAALDFSERGASLEREFLRKQHRQTRCARKRAISRTTGSGQGGVGTLCWRAPVSGGG